MSTSEWLSFAGIAIALIINIMRSGTRFGQVEEKLDNVAKKLDKMEANNRSDHERIFDKIDGQGQRIASLEGKANK